MDAHEPTADPAGPLFETARLAVHALGDEHLDALCAVYGDADAMRYVDDGEPLDRAGCQEWIRVTRGNVSRRGYGMSAVVRRDTGEVAGFCGLVHPGGQPEAELKYAFHRDHRGRGLATEAARGLLAWGARRFGLSEVIATVAPGNAASLAVLGRLGMRHVSTRRNDDGSLTEVHVWRVADA